MKPSDTITLNAPSEFPLQILHEVAIMTILITRGESLRARPLPPARCARCLPTAPPVFPQRLQQKQTKTAVFQFQKTNAFLFSRALPAFHSALSSVMSDEPTHRFAVDGASADVAVVVEAGVVVAPTH